MDIRERAAFESSQVASMIRGGGLDVEVMPSGEFSTEEMILNIGPQHPSTHGVLRVVLELDGEVITKAEPVIGYMHRAAEKLAEYRDARQVLVLMNRHDWLSAFNNELGWTIAVERLAGIEVPERAQWIRTMFAEWNRILNHLMFSGSYPLELGCHDPDLLRVPRARDDPGPDGVRDRRADAPFLLPRRWTQGRSAVRLPEALRGGARRDAEADRGVRDADHGQRDHLRPHARRRTPARRNRHRVRHVRARAPRERRPDGSAEGRAVREVRGGRVRGAGGHQGRLLRPPVGADRADEAVLQHHRAVHGPAPARRVQGTEAPEDPEDGRRGLRPDREPARPDGLLRRRRREEAALPAEDADGLVLERQRASPRCSRAPWSRT